MLLNETNTVLLCLSSVATGVYLCSFYFNSSFKFVNHSPRSTRGKRAKAGIQRCLCLG